MTFFVVDIILVKKVRLESPIIAQLERAKSELDSRYMSIFLRAFVHFENNVL